MFAYILYPGKDQRFFSLQFLALMRYFFLPTVLPLPLTVSLVPSCDFDRSGAICALVVCSRLHLVPFSLCFLRAFLRILFPFPPNASREKTPRSGLFGDLSQALSPPCSAPPLLCLGRLRPLLRLRLSPGHRPPAPCPIHVAPFLGSSRNRKISYRASPRGARPYWSSRSR